MVRKRARLAGLLTLIATSSSAGAPPVSTSAELSAAVSDRRLLEAVRVFGGLAHPTADDQYLTGFALLELHRPIEAEPRLRAAKDARFNDAWPGWPRIDALLDRARTCREIAPPLRAPADPAVFVHAGAPTAWSEPVLAAITEFADVGRRIFGRDIPTLRFYLFEDRPSYDRFFDALFGVKVPTAWQDGTGNLNVVVYCEKDRLGQITRVAGLPETVSCVLHEFGHAWFGTYLMDRHGREWLSPSMRRPWLDEGLADYVASLREPAFLDRRVAWLKAKASKGVAAPTFDEIAEYRAFYETGDAVVHYAVSALLVAELLGARDRAPETILRILDASGRTGDVEDAVKTVTGKDFRQEFARVVRKFWP